MWGGGAEFWGAGVDERGGEVRHRNEGLGEVWLKKSPRLERRY